MYTNNNKLYQHRYSGKQIGSSKNLQLSSLAISPSHLLRSPIPFWKQPPWQGKRRIWCPVEGVLEIRYRVSWSLVWGPWWFVVVVFFFWTGKNQMFWSRNHATWKPYFGVSSRAIIAIIVAFEPKPSGWFASCVFWLLPGKINSVLGFDMICSDVFWIIPLMERIQHHLASILSGEFCPSTLLYALYDSWNQIALIKSFSPGFLQQIHW